MSAPFQMAGSTITGDSVGRGALNPMVSQWASKPSAVTVDVTGRMSPRKLGVGHDDRTVASRSLLPERTLNEVVPRRLALSLKGTVEPGCNVSVGAFARISEAPPPGCVCAADRNVVGRAESRQIAACPKGDEALVPEELAIPVIRQIVQAGFVRDQKSALQL